ncbi:IS110 family transposase, partial [Massilia sp. TS11]|uniref:IS110 family transposase n=1 Tax=Massilia sp. TS11 TaxID=2908003 RepID=UPI001EDB4B37
MNTESLAVIGIDVSKRKLDVALLIQGKLKSKVVENSGNGLSELEAWLRKQQLSPAAVHACLESTGIYSEPVALGLLERGFTVSLVNPARVKGYAQSEQIRNKNDAVDAAVIARFCTQLRPEPWQAPAPEVRQLRAWGERLQALKDMRQQEWNRMEALQFGSQELVLAHTQKHVDWLDQQIRELEGEIDDHIDRHPNLKRDSDLLTSIPGLGPRTAAKLLGVLGDIRRFRSAKALAAFVGVTPRQRESGTLRRRTVISRMGRADLRTALYMPSVVALTHNPVLRAYATKLSARGMAKMAVIGAISRKLIHQIYGVICNGKP